MKVLKETNRSSNLQFYSKLSDIHEDKARSQLGKYILATGYKADTDVQNYQDRKTKVWKNSEKNFTFLHNRKSTEQKRITNNH